MTRRNTPVETALTSTVEFPSALFDEIFPYERFAHNLLSGAVEALHSKDLPPSIFVEFAALPEGQYPWNVEQQHHYSDRFIRECHLLPVCYPSAGSSDCLRARGNGIA